MASFDEVIPPGKAGSIRTSVHTANLRGSISKAITVTHNDASQGAISLTLSAKIVGSVSVFPYPALQLADRRKGFATPAKLLVRKDDTEQGTLALDELTASVPWLKVSSRKVTAPEPAEEGLPPALPGDVVVSAQAKGAPVGSSVVNFSFKTGLTREPAVTIPVTVYVQPIVTMQPSELILHPDQAQAGGGASGQVLASIRTDLDPKTVAVTSDVPAFAVRVDPPGERAFKIIVDWSGKGKNPATEGTIQIRVGTETISLPVRVDLPRAAKAP